MNVDVGEVCADLELGHLREPVRVDKDGSLGAELEVVDLEPHGAGAVQGQQAQDGPAKVVHRVPLQQNSGCISKTHKTAINAHFADPEVRDQKTEL